MTDAPGTRERLAKSAFRPDIEGLRALAIGLVLVFHAGAPVLRGGFVGVDVFFVISGFLITGMLIREIELTGRVKLSRFWARRAKRLLPASVLVLVATAAAAWLLAPITSWKGIGADIVAAALYLVNWRFAAEAVDYNAEGGAISPVLHFWSLAVEEQFYIVWPILLSLMVPLVLKRIAPHMRRRVIGAVLGAIVASSLAWSLVYTSENPEGAFFVTTTRLWELGIGALVAVGTRQWHRLPGLLALLLGWAGFAAVIIAALMFSEADAWPGARALVPVLGTALVIVSTTGREIPRGSIARLLSLRPLVWLGALSYSWYLWHWPVLVLAEAHFGELRLRYTLLLTLGSGVLAWLSLHLVENPIRRAPVLSKSNLLALSGGANLSLVGVTAGLILILLVPSSSTAQADLSRLGANALRDGSVSASELAKVDTVDFMVPSPAEATDDMPLNFEECVSHSEEVVSCELGNPDSAVKITLFGDSKIQQMSDAFETVVKENDWYMRTYFKSGCAVVYPSPSESDKTLQECAVWNEATIEHLLKEKPEYVVTGIRSVHNGSDENGDIFRGVSFLKNQWNQLQNAGITVVPYLDNPAPPFEVYECVAEHPEEILRCSFDREEGIAKSGQRFQVPAMEALDMDVAIDLSEAVCPMAERCPAVIGNVLVYRQGSHITNTYVTTMADALDEQLVPIIESLGG